LDHLGSTIGAAGPDPNILTFFQSVLVSQGLRTAKYPPLLAYHLPAKLPIAHCNGRLGVEFGAHFVLCTMTSSVHVHVEFTGRLSPSETEEKMQLLASCAQGVSRLKVVVNMHGEHYEEACGRILKSLGSVLGAATCGVRRLALQHFPFDAQNVMLLTTGLVENGSVRELQFSDFWCSAQMAIDGMDLLGQFLSNQDRIQRLEFLDCILLAGRMVGQLAAASTSLETLICKGRFKYDDCVGELLGEIAVVPHLKRLDLLKLTLSHVDVLSCWLGRMTALRYLTISFTIEGWWRNNEFERFMFYKRKHEASLRCKLPGLVSSLRLNDSLHKFVLQDEYGDIPSPWLDHRERVLVYGKRNRRLPEILQTIAVESRDGDISDSAPLLPTLLSVAHNYTRETTIRILFNQMLTTDSIGLMGRPQKRMLRF
jgi:hypothetical protein